MNNQLSELQLAMNWTIVDLPFGPILELPPDLPPGESALLEHRPSFTHDIGVRPGMLLELESGDRYLVGDINPLGGGCDDCPLVSRNDIIHRYAVVWIKASIVWGEEVVHP